MTEHNGSRWYFPTYEGLVDAKHQDQMGNALWLYMYCVKYAFVAQDDGLFDYNHTEAAKELGVGLATVKRWFSALREYGYINTRARRRYHLEVEIANWRTVEDWHNTREDDGRSTTRSITRSITRQPKDDTSHTISIRLSSYYYPNGSHSDASRISLADAFRGLVENLKISKNRAATLRQIYKLCFGGIEEALPDYGYLGKAAKLVGGAERLSMLMWELTTRPPADPLAYIIKVHGKGDKSNAPRIPSDGKLDAQEQAIAAAFEARARTGD